MNEPTIPDPPRPVHVEGATARAVGVPTFEEARIEGTAIHGNTPFSVPLASHIAGNLWTGGCIDGVRLPHDFEFVISLYPWAQYELGPDTVRRELQAFDAHHVSAELVGIAEIAAACVEHGKTLVHCQAGLNRSGLVGALVLLHQGMTPGAAIALLRARRSPAVLCNTTFEAFVRALAAKPLLDRATRTPPHGDAL